MALDHIKTIVIMFLENRSFDHMLGYLSLDSSRRIDVEGLRSDRAWLNEHANQDLRRGIAPTAPTPLSQYIKSIVDPPHGIEAISKQINTPSRDGPDMGGFIAAYVDECDQTDAHHADYKHVMGYYDAAAVHMFEFFARNFAVCDNWFSSLPTATQPNRLMAMSGHSLIADNIPIMKLRSGFRRLSRQELVYDWLDGLQEVEWCSYHPESSFPFFMIMEGQFWRIYRSLNSTRPASERRFRRITEFHRQWNSEEKMDVIFIEPKYTDDKVGSGQPNDDHPPTGVAAGQAYLLSIYNTLISNPARWRDTMMIVTYDEHGGFFDHVCPPKLNTRIGDVTFETLGPRVPALVVSQHIPANTVFKGRLDHTSVLQLLSEKFGQPYSASVQNRQEQGKLQRLSEILPARPPDDVRIPRVPLWTRALIRLNAAMLPRSTVGPRVPRNETAEAFHQMALGIADAAQGEPQLLTGPLGQEIQNYIAQLPVQNPDPRVPA